MINKLLLVVFIALCCCISVFAQSSGGSGGGAGCCIGIFVIVIIAVVVMNINAGNRQKELKNAALTYQQSLHQLKSNPTNPNFRERTLQLGRHYSNLTRDKKGVTIFDEVALSNDINAACAGAVHHTAPVRQVPAIKSLEQRLIDLADLRAKGLIDEVEYNAKRGKLLDEI